MTKHSNVTEKKPGSLQCGSAPKREGVALIIVLGMMAILMIMGVAFSISMRTERMGAGSFRFGIGSRHMVWAGLARAIDDIDRSMATNGYVYPNFDVLPSAGFGSVRIAFADSADYVPAALRERVRLAESGWVVGSTAGSGADDGSIQGRMAYLVVDCSGFLDANHVGGRNRWAGYSPSEIVITNLAEVLDANAFTNARANTDLRYESLPDLYVCQSNWGLSTYPSNFVTYSHFPWGAYDGAAVHHNMFDIGGKDRTQLAGDRAEIISRLVASGIAPGQAPFVFTNLLDYVDPSPVPTHLNAPNTKSVPMLSEMVMTGGVFRMDDGDGSMWARAGLWINAEWHYPFIAPSPHAFELETEVTIALSNTTHAVGSVITRTDTLALGYNTDIDVERYHYLTLPPFAPPRVPMTEETNMVQVTASIRARIRIAGGGDIVDQMPSPWTAPPLTIVSPQINPQLGVADIEWFSESREMIDPRFNWNSAHWVNPAAAGASIGGPFSSSLGTENAWTLFYWTNRADFVDTDSALYVANRGSLVSVGELGNLLQGRQAPQDYWQTIRLLDHPALRRHNVLDHFTVHDTNTVRRGLVNVNTTNRQVLASAFVGMPWGYPENTNDVMTLAEANMLADGIVAFRQAGGVFTNVADLAALDWSAAFPARREVEHESAISHSYGLFGTRQNLFAIYVVAGPFAPGLGEIARREHQQMGDWLGYQRALFYVWRDPFPIPGTPPGEPKRHRVFVHMFKWLTGGD